MSLSCARTLLFMMLLALCHEGIAAEPASVSASAPEIRENFDTELSKDWYWGLGRWRAGDGILRGFESGPRRHGPIKLRRMQMRDGTVECEFRLVGKARFAGLIFNGAKDRGHIVHVIVGR